MGDAPPVPPPLNLPQAPPPKRLTKAERKALEEKRKREAAAAAAKRAPKIEPKMGKFVADRGQADEKTRIVGLFKEFCDRGKVPLSMLSSLIKEIFKPVEKEDKLLVKKLSALATEALSDKAGKGLQAGDLTTWYFDVAWPMIDEARHGAKAAAEAQRAAEAKAAAEAEEARRAAEAEAAEQAAKEAEALRREEEARAAEAAAAAREAEEARRREDAEKAKLEERRRAAQQPQQPPHPPPHPHPPSPPPPDDSHAGDGAKAQGSQQHSQPPSQPAQPAQPPAQPHGAGGGGGSSGSSGLRIEPAGLSASGAALYEPELPLEPAGWAAARSIDLAEHRRLLGLLAPRALPPDDSRRGDAPPTAVLLPASAVRGALAEALLPLEDAALLAEAPRAHKGTAGVPIGRVVHFWFEHVWPKHHEALEAQRDKEGADVEPDKSTGEAPAAAVAD